MLALDEFEQLEPFPGRQPREAIQLRHDHAGQLPGRYVGLDPVQKLPVRGRALRVHLDAVLFPGEPFPLGERAIQVHLEFRRAEALIVAAAARAHPPVKRIGKRFRRSGLRPSDHRVRVRLSHSCHLSGEFGGNEISRIGSYQDPKDFELVNPALELRMARLLPACGGDRRQAAAVLRLIAAGAALRLGLVR